MAEMEERKDSMSGNIEFKDADRKEEKLKEEGYTIPVSKKEIARREKQAEKDRINAERIARGEIFACPMCGKLLDFGMNRCPRCQAFLDPVTGQIREEVSDEELQRNLQAGVRTRKLGKYLLAAGIIIVIIGLLKNGAIGFGIIIAGGILAVYGARLRQRAEGEYKAQLGQTVIRQVLSEAFDHVYEYNPGGHIDNGIIKRTHMVFPFDFHEIEGSDYVKARYRGVDIEMSDITLIRVIKSTYTDDHGNDQETEKRKTMFEGQWIVCNFHKKLSADLSVFEGGRRKGQIETENDAFNRKYGISCSSAHDAFYILTPHMMENILAMDDRADGDTYMRFLREGKVHLAINSGRNNFEIGKMNKASVDRLREKFRDELQYITDVIDLLLSIDTMYTS